MRSVARDSCVRPSSRRRSPARASDLAVAVYELLGCRGFGRVDLLLDSESGELYVLEADTVPGLTETSLLPQAADAAGIGFDQLIERILEAARALRLRTPRRSPRESHGRGSP